MPRQQLFPPGKPYCDYLFDSGRAWYNELRGRTTYDEGYRVINAENDFIPGLIVDRYNDWLVMQALTLHIDMQKRQIAQLLAEAFESIGIPVKGIYERSDVDVRHKEGLKEETGLLWGEEPPEYIDMGVEAMKYLVDVRRGHKTGYYLDQKENHRILENLAHSKLGANSDNSLLNLFSYKNHFYFMQFFNINWAHRPFVYIYGL